MFQIHVSGRHFKKANSIFIRFNPHLTFLFEYTCYYSILQHNIQRLYFFEKFYFSGRRRKTLEHLISIPESDDSSLVLLNKLAQSFLNKSKGQMTRVSLTKDKIIYFLFNSSIMQSNICQVFNVHVHILCLIRLRVGYYRCEK